MPSRPRSLTLVLGFLLVAGVLPPAAAAAETDIHVDDDGGRVEPYMETAVATGLLEACNPPANDRFCPEQAMTRGETAMLLVRLLDAPLVETDHYVDDDGHPAEHSIDSLAELGVMLGCDETRFCPDRPVRRDEFAAFVSSALRWEIPASTAPYEDLGGSAYGAPMAELGRRGALEACDRPVGRRLCPWQHVTRDEAVFSLMSALDLEPSAGAARSSDLPTIGFSDGFESVSPWDGRAPGRRNQISLSSEGFTGSGLRVDIPEGSHFGADFHLDLSDTLGEDPVHLYFRYFIRLDPDWAPTSSGKLPGFSGVYGRTGKGGLPSEPSAPGWSARLQFFPAEDGDLRARLGYYVYHLGQQRSYGDTLPWNEAGRLVPGDWYCIEGEIDVNTLGQADGALRAWVDGTPAFDSTGFEFRRPEEPHIRIDSFWFNVYYGGPVTAERDLGLTIDEVVVDTERVGCGVGEETARPVAGDFDGDGFADSLRWGDCAGDTCFIQETTSIDGSQSLDRLSGRAWFSLESHQIAMVAGDVDGDGVDDLVYRGRCDGSVRCWRVHRFSGSTWGVGENWGNGAWLAHPEGSVVVGDWNGDRLEDLAYQGVCGGDHHRCWRVHFSTGSRFAAPSDWGVPPDAGVSPVAADIDGDALDDLIYPAPCGEETCWVVQSSSGDRFGDPTVLGLVMDHELDWNTFVDFDGDRRADSVSVGPREAGSEIVVRLLKDDGLGSAVGVAEFDGPVSAVALRRGHRALEARVTLSCEEGTSCVEHLLAWSMRFLPPNLYRQEFHDWLRFLRVE